MLFYGLVDQRRGSVLQALADAGSEFEIREASHGGEAAAALARETFDLESVVSEDGSFSIVIGITLLLCLLTFVITSASGIDSKLFTPTEDSASSSPYFTKKVKN